MLENVTGFSPVDKDDIFFSGGMFTEEDYDWCKKTVYYCPTCDIVYDYGMIDTALHIHEPCPRCHEKGLQKITKRLAKRYLTLGY